MSTIVYEREMGITHRDYLRTVPSAVEGRTFTIRDGRVTIVDGQNQIDIELGPERVRRIASIKLPVTDVTYRFRGHTQEEADAVMARFELYYRRGGG